MQPKPFLDPGQMCGRYEIVRRIGRGGYGEVYEAVDGAEQAVALKVLRVDNADDRRAAQRLLLEAKTLRAIEHINVVSYRDWGFFGKEFLWLAMELLRGKTLHELLHGERMLSPERACRIGRQICTALIQAHELGAVHRDIKPGNIFVLPGDVVKLLDFGIVKHRDVPLGTTAAVGTPLYMSPDYLRHGPGGEGDVRWDIYAVAMVVYECMTGRHPFVHPEEGQPSLGTIVQRHMSEPVPPLRDVIEGCPERVSACIAKGLEKDAKQRWSTAAEFEEELIACCRLFAKSDDVLDQLARLSSSPEPDAPVKVEGKVEASAAFAATETVDRDVAPLPSWSVRSAAPTRKIELNELSPSPGGSLGTLPMQEVPAEVVARSGRDVRAYGRHGTLIAPTPETGAPGLPGEIETAELDAPATGVRRLMERAWESRLLLIGIIIGLSVAVLLIAGARWLR